LHLLSYLIIAPESLPPEQREIYFGKDKEEVRLSELIKKVISDEEIDEGKTSPSIIDTHRDFISFSSKTKTREFLEELDRDYGGFNIHLEKNTRNKNKSKKIKFNTLVILGDSLSDAGRLYKTSLIGKISGIDKNNSPYGAFTNAVPWSMAEQGKLANCTILDAVKKQGKDLDATDVSDELISGAKKAHTLYKLDHNKRGYVGGKLITRTYALGGLTSYDYGRKISSRLSLTLTRLFVSTLRAQRKELLVDDLREKRTLAEKANSLVIEFTGANDLATVNAAPSIKAAERALDARIENIEELVKNGYRQFILCNVPDLSRTPRFMEMALKDPASAENAKKCCEHFNVELQKRCSILQKLYPHCDIQIFDVNAVVNDYLTNPDKYGFSSKYEFEMCTSFPERLEKNKIYLSRDDKSNVFNYQVVDPCGQVRKGSLLDDQLVKKGALPPDPTAAENVKKILAITEERGHTLSDLMVPLKDTKAFKTYMEEKNSQKIQGKPGIPLPGGNQLFYDDVHPSGRLHAMLQGEIDDFITHRHQFVPPDIDVAAKPARRAKEAPF